MDCPGFWGHPLREVPFHILGPAMIADSDRKAIKVSKYMVFGWNSKVFEEPKGLIKRLLCVPCRHEEIIGFPNPEILLDNAHVHGVMNILAPVAPCTKVGKASIQKRAEQFH